MKHSFLFTSNVTSSMKIARIIILALLVMVTGSPSFGQARRGAKGSARTTTTKPSQNLVNNFNKVFKDRYFFNYESSDNECDVVFKPANASGKGSGYIVVHISSQCQSFSYSITANGSVYIKVDVLNMKGEKITWHTNPDGFILENMFFQAQSDSRKYDELINWEQNKDPEAEAEIETEPSSNDSDKVCDVVDEKPSFPGGEKAMLSFLSSNLKYPIVARENGVQGHVIVQFVVERDGSISDLKAIRSEDPSLDKEAMRLVKSMPKWNPGKLNGTAVRARGTVSVVFRL